MKLLLSKSFLRGYIRAIDLSSTKAWMDFSEDKKKDYEALREDWKNVGDAIRKGTRDFKRT